jgi:hypothetical protein
MHSCAIQLHIGLSGTRNWMQVNERGKVSSRPGPQSPKELAKQRKQQQPSADNTPIVQSQQQNDVSSTSGADVATTTTAQSSNTPTQQPVRQTAPSVTPQVSSSILSELCTKLLCTSFRLCCCVVLYKQLVLNITFSSIILHSRISRNPG